MFFRGGWKDVTSVVWLNWMCGRGIRNSVVGIVGCGNIGTSIARKLKTFAISQLLYTSRTEKPAGKMLYFSYKLYTAYYIRTITTFNS